MQVTDHEIELRGLVFHYRDWDGHSTPMVLLHGLASQSHIFDLTAPLLAEHFRVVALDQRGHGESGKPERGYDFETITGDLLAFLDALQFKRAILVGHSWGGNVALQFGAQHPERTAALVLVDGGFLELQGDPRMTWERTEKELAPPNLLGTPVDDFKSMVHAHMGASWKPAFEQVILANFEVLPDRTIRPRLSYDHHMQILRSLWEQRSPELLSAVRCPVLMVPAQSDAKDAQTAAFVAAKRAAVARAEQMPAPHETIWFRHTVHDIPLHRPRKLANAILRFAVKYGL